MMLHERSDDLAKAHCRGLLEKDRDRSVVPERMNWPEYMDDENLSKLVRSIDEVYERAVVLNSTHGLFTLRLFRGSRQDEDDRAGVHLLLLLPGQHFNQGTLASSGDTHERRRG